MYLKNLPNGTLTLPYNVNITGDLKVDNNINWHKSGTNYLGLLQKNTADGANIKLKNKHNRETVLIYSLYGNKEGRIYVRDVNGVDKFTVKEDGVVGTTGNLNVGGGLTVNEDINMKASKSIKCDGRLHIFTNERLYLLAVDNTWITHDWGANGNLNVTGSCLIKNTLTVGAASGRKMVIQPSSHGTEQTYLAFFNGDTRTSYMCPYTDGKVGFSGNVDVPGNIYVSNAHFSVANDRDKWYSEHRHDHHGMVTTWPRHGQ